MKHPCLTPRRLATALVIALVQQIPQVSAAESNTTSPPRMLADQAREENAYAVGLQAYLWGFPLWYYGKTIPEALELGGSNLNDWRKFSNLKTAQDKFVTTPNNVTIDAYATLDLTSEPVVLFVPNLTEPRWYLVRIGDTFDEVIRNIGGTKGPQPGVYIVTGPDYEGTVPGDMVQIKSPTKIGIATTSILVNGMADLAKAVETQKGFRMMPLSAYLKFGLAYKRSFTASILAYQSDALEGFRYFDELGYWMSKMLPTAADTDNELVVSFHQIGLSVGKGLEWQDLDEPTKRGLARAVQVASQIIDSKWSTASEITNGWKYTLAGGPGSDPVLRAALAKYETGAQLPDQVIYPNTGVGDTGEALTGAHNYVLYFEANKLPPISVLWNLSMYGSDMLFVENDFGRYSIGSTTDGLKKNTDGSLTIFIQKDRPAETSNWLPAPAGNFNLTMRLYGPGTAILDGSYRLPAVKRVQ